jgi:hypothetical protein
LSAPMQDGELKRRFAAHIFKQDPDSGIIWKPYNQ